MADSTLAVLRVLEHLTDLDGAMREFSRDGPRPPISGAWLPIRNFVTDAFFREAGYEPRKLHPSSHRDIEQAIRRQPLLSLDHIRVLPEHAPADLGLY